MVFWASGPARLCRFAALFARQHPGSTREAALRISRGCVNTSDSSHHPYANNQSCAVFGVPISHHQEGKKPGTQLYTSQNPSKFGLIPAATDLRKKIAA